MSNRSLFISVTVVVRELVGSYGRRRIFSFFKKLKNHIGWGYLVFHLPLQRILTLIELPLTLDQRLLGKAI